MMRVRVAEAVLNTRSAGSVARSNLPSDQRIERAATTAPESIHFRSPDEVIDLRFKSHCGWLSFDEVAEGIVQEGLAFGVGMSGTLHTSEGR